MFESMSERLITQMKATEQYFLAVLFNILYKVVLTLLAEEEILRLAAEQYFSVMFIMLHENFQTLSPCTNLLSVISQIKAIR